MLNVTLESLSDMIFRGTIENVILDPNNYLNWLRLASQFGGPSSTISKLPFFCYEKAVELSGSAETPCYHLAECYENGVCCQKNLYEKFYDRKRNHGDFSYAFFERLAPVGLCR